MGEQLVMADGSELLRLMGEQGRVVQVIQAQAKACNDEKKSDSLKVKGKAVVLGREEGLVVSNPVMRSQTCKKSICFDPAWQLEKEGTGSNGKGKEGTGRKQVETERAPEMGLVGLGKESLKSKQGEESGAVKEQVEALLTKKGEGRKPPVPDGNKPGGKKRVQFEDVEMTDDMKARGRSRQSPSYHFMSMVQELVDADALQEQILSQTMIMLPLG
ncbi:hypothetical protein C0995_015212 [Termitomyces sp. Mi166|nr:hypothetical protein C0995_015212 [Termitomyces sp. Mi166\